MSPASAFAWYLWTRHRRGLTLLGVYWLTAMICCRAAPDGVFVFDGASISYANLMFSLFCGGAVVAFGYLLLIFSFSQEVRLEACESGFPIRLRTLPVGTRTLAGWPMLWGSAAMMLAWLTLAWAARRPGGFEVAMAWPGLLFAVILAWLQAIVWTPFPLPWVRAFLFFPMSSFLIIIPTIFLKSAVHPLVGYILLIVLLLSSYGIAFCGVGRARRGQEARWTWPAWLRWKRTATFHRPPFPSAARAQLWFEWRRGGFAFPGVVAAVSLLWFPWVMSPMLLEADSFWPTVAFFSTFFMLMLASACGVVMGNLPGRKQCRSLSSFLATRPLSNENLLRIKFETAALSSLAGGAVLASALILWGVLGNHFETMWQHQSVSRFCGRLLLFACSVLVLTWAQMVGHLWMGLTRHASMATNFILGSPTTIVLSLLGLHAVGAFELRQTFAELLPWWASGALMLKCLAAAWSLHALRRRNLLSSGILWGAVVLWFVLAAGLFAAMYVLLPGDWFSASGVVLGIVLFLPLTRLALAPLALADNRHR